jgi:hypothetical protein
MANKLPKIIGQLTEAELIRLKKDLEAGHINELVQRRLNSFSPTSTGICPVCNAEVNDEHYTLIFGPKSFKQKASFDGVDCLQYFLERLKQKEHTQEQL